MLNVPVWRTCVHYDSNDENLAAVFLDTLARPCCNGCLYTCIYVWYFVDAQCKHIRIHRAEKSGVGVRAHFKYQYILAMIHSRMIVCYMNVLNEISRVYSRCDISLLDIIALRNVIFTVLLELTISDDQSSVIHHKRHNRYVAD